MDITKMLAELHADREIIDQVILTLERLARGGAKRRGRPPKWMNDQNSAGPKMRGRPPGSKMSAANRNKERIKAKTPQ
jgi:hypothetical protein